ncbi:C-C motif chemokine 19-like [Tiliqua scincoides]|uniref:C-C motif chemokine 19-like n=1 Tax=Tiliqua scincoides TaxID=71010 RepID=UPI003462B512
MALRSQLLLCLLAALVCTLQVQGSDNAVLDCCHGTTDRPFSVKQAHRLRTYRIQGPQMGCHISAIVLITKKGRELCAPPDAPWALDLKRRLDERVARQKQQRSRLSV